MDDIAAFRRATALLDDKTLRKPADLTDKHFVRMASPEAGSRRKSDGESARDILSECSRRLLDTGESNAQPVVALLLALSSDWSPSPNLHRRISVQLLAEALDFVDERRDVLGQEFTAYLTDCINRAKAQHPMARLTDEQLADFEQEYQPDWLGQAFNITPRKGDGQPTNPERIADILDGCKLIFESLQEKSEDYLTGLEEMICSFEPGDESKLPFCIERLIKLKGYPAAESYLPIIRIQLAQFIVDEIERLRSTKITHWRHMAAANIFVKCHDACVEQVRLLLEQPDTSDLDRELLRERREILRDYGSESLQRNNSGNAAGIARLLRQRNKIHSQIKRSPKVNDLDQTENVLAEIESDKEKRAARNDPVVRAAIRIINSPSVGNHSRRDLRKLQKQTPSEYQFVWPGLWIDFEQSLARTLRKMR